MAIRLAAFCGHPHTGKLTNAVGYLKSVTAFFKREPRVLYIGHTNSDLHEGIADIVVVPYELDRNIAIQTMQLASRIRQENISAVLIELPTSQINDFEIDVTELFASTDLVAMAYTDKEMAEVSYINGVLRPTNRD